MPAPRPLDEADRLTVLAELGILDTPAEEAYDQITRLAAHACGTPVALVTFVDSERQWFKSRFGLSLEETTRESAFCAHALAGQVLVVEDALADQRFAHNPLVLDAPCIRAYAGVPVRVNGQPLGSLCVIDRRPRGFDDGQLFSLRALARQVEVELALRWALVHVAEERLHLDRALAAKRDLLTLIVHDLKAPLGTVMLASSHLLEVSDEPLLHHILLAADAMNRLVLDLLDLARFDEQAMRVHRVPLDLVPLLKEIAKRFELHEQAQQRRISWTVPESARVVADAGLLRRVVDNLLDNALKYSPAGTPVEVEVEAEGDGGMILRVRDQGRTIPKADRERIFSRWEGEQAGTSRGLGLSFCKRVVEVHGGHIEAHPRPGGGNELVVSLPAS